MAVTDGEVSALVGVGPSRRRGAREGSAADAMETGGLRRRSEGPAGRAEQVFLGTYDSSLKRKSYFIELIYN